MKTYRDFIQYFSEEPERTVAYKAMQKTLYPRGGTTWKGKETATLTNVGGFKSRKRDKKAKRNRGYGSMKTRLMAMREDSPTMSVGTGGFTSAADPKGPVAGYDLPFKGTIMRRWREAANKRKKRA